MKYPGIAQLVARQLWEQGARVRATAIGKPGNPWDTRADSTFPLACNWSKNDLDHMFDHNWKTSQPGVAQLVARMLWERGARVRVSTHGNPAKPWGIWVDSTFPLACNWSKNDLDHMFDHNWKI